MMVIVCEKEENFVGEGGNAVNQHFLLFLQDFEMLFPNGH